MISVASHIDRIDSKDEDADWPVVVSTSIPVLVVVLRIQERQIVVLVELDLPAVGEHPVRKESPAREEILETPQDAEPPKTSQKEECGKTTQPTLFCFHKRMYVFNTYLSISQILDSDPVSLNQSMNPIQSDTPLL